jgi:hypothetical protein
LGKTAEKLLPQKIGAKLFMIINTFAVTKNRAGLQKKDS